MTINVSGIKIFLNPAANTIILENLQNKKFTYQFINASGALVKSNTTQANRIDVSDLINKTNLLKIFIADFSVSQKVVIQH